MASLRIFFAALTLAAATLTFAAPSASAQGTKVVVIDQARIMRESQGGVDIQNKVRAIEEQMTTEMQPEAQTIESERARLQTQQQTLSESSPEADIVAFNTSYQSLLQRAQVFNQTRQIRAQELALTERKAWGLFFQQLEPVLQEVVDQNGASVILDRSQIVYGAPAIDVTDDVIGRINARAPTITVTRETLPQQQAAAPQ